MSIWKSGLESAATYKALMEVFVRAGRMRCAESVAEILREGAISSRAGKEPTPAAAADTLAEEGDTRVEEGTSSSSRVSIEIEEEEAEKIRKAKTKIK